MFAWSSGSRSFALRLMPGLVLVAVAAWAGALLMLKGKISWPGCGVARC